MAVVTEAFEHKYAFEAQAHGDVMNIRGGNLPSDIELTDYHALANLSDGDHGLQSRLGVLSRVLWSGVEGIQTPRYDEACAALNLRRVLRQRQESSSGIEPDPEFDDLVRRVEDYHTKEFNTQVESLGGLVVAQELGLWVRLNEKEGDIPEADPSGMLLSRLAKLTGFEIQKDDEGGPVPIPVVVGTNGVAGLLKQRSNLYVPRKV